MKRSARIDFTTSAFCLFIFLLLESPASAHPGWGIVVDKQNQIYFGDVTSNTIWKITAYGRLEAVASNKHSHSLYIDEAGNLYGEHVYYDQAGNRWISSVWRLAPDGHLLDIVPQTSHPASGSGVLVDREGNVYSVRGGASLSERTELIRRAPDGQITVLAGGERGHADGRGNEAQFRYIVGMAWGPDGSLYVTDASSVRRIMMDQTVTTIGSDPLAGVERSEDPRILGLTVDSAGNVYVADYEHRSIRRIASDGTVTTPVECGLFWSPTGVVANGDDLFILEHYPEAFPGVIMAFVGPYARVRKLSADGTVTTLITVWGWTETNIIGAAVGAGALIALSVWIRRKQR
ncbi:MAG TPA: SMP-30/gluconolactonase/LRE family protein, partial [Blastocatellia bacterium]